MNRLLLPLYSLLFCVLISCAGGGKPAKMIEAVEKTDSCKLDPKNTYELYISAMNNPEEKLPLLIILDPHGSGKSALDKFIPAADHYRAVLVASNLIKNGYGNYEEAIRALIEDVRLKYPAGETIFIAGFSGGARMALGYAMNHKVGGLILCGALANAGQINALRCPVFSISGMDDFNFMETAQYLFQEKSIPQNLRIELTNASHDWPDSLMLANTFGFLCLACPDKDIPSSTRSQLKKYCQDQHSRIDALKEQGDLLKAELVARNMSVTGPFNSDKTFASTWNELKADPSYIRQLKRLQKSLETEINARQQYLDAFATKDSIWWKNEVKALNENIRTEQDPNTNDLYRRIKGFLGIACYSLGNQAIKEKNAEKLNKIVTIYRLLEPDNPQILYFSAFPYFWKGNNEATINMLKKAREAGFSDSDQLKKDFPGSIASEL